MLLIANKLLLSSASVFHKNSLILACCSLGKLEIKTLTPNRLKNQTNDTLKLLDNICNPNSSTMQLFGHKKVWSLHCSTFSQKLPNCTWHTFHSIKIRTLTNFVTKESKTIINNLESNYEKYNCEWHFNRRH